eukprot:g1846.t1
MSFLGMREGTTRSRSISSFSESSYGEPHYGEFRTIGSMDDEQLWAAGHLSLKYRGNRGSLDDSCLDDHEYFDRLFSGKVNDSSNSKSKGSSGSPGQRYATLTSSGHSSNGETVTFVRRRANSTNSFFLKDTMSNPDITSALWCVAAVIRARMIADSKHSKRMVRRNGRQGTPSSSKASVFELFDDPRLVKRFHSGDMSVMNIPELEVIHNFVTKVYEKAQMEADSIIMALVYTERLLKISHHRKKVRSPLVNYSSSSSVIERNTAPTARDMKEANYITNSKIRQNVGKEGMMLLTPVNWQSLVFIAMVLASKVWDDLSMWNVDFSQVQPSFTLKRVNQLEVAFLTILDFNVRVTASQYAKYYFQLRALLPSLKREEGYCNDFNYAVNTSSSKFNTLALAASIAGPKPFSLRDMTRKIGRKSDAEYRERLSFFSSESFPDSIYENKENHSSSTTTDKNSKPGHHDGSDIRKRSYTIDVNMLGDAQLDEFNGVTLNDSSSKVNTKIKINVGLPKRHVNASVEQILEEQHI